MSDLSFTPFNPDAQPEPAAVKPKRSRPAKAAKEPRQKRRVAAPKSMANPDAPRARPEDIVLAWWDILVQLDAAARKQVLEKILR